MPSIWSKISDYWTWFLWGKTPYAQLSDVQKQEARRDLYSRLFFIANAPFFGAVFATFQLSIIPANGLKTVLDKCVPAGRDRWNGRLAFCTYCVLHAITMTAAMTFIVAPCYIVVYKTSFYLVLRLKDHVFSYFSS